MFVGIILSALKPLQQYWKELAVIGMIGLLLYQNFAEERFLFFLETIPSLEIRLDIATSNFETCKTGNEVLTDSINQRNDEISQWKSLSDTLEERNEELSGIIEDNQQVTEEAVQEILSVPAPTTCKGAIDLLRNSTEELAW